MVFEKSKRTLEKTCAFQFFGIKRDREKRDFSLSSSSFWGGVAKRRRPGSLSTHPKRLVSLSVSRKKKRGADDHQKTFFFSRQTSADFFFSLALPTSKTFFFFFRANETAVSDAKNGAETKERGKGIFQKYPLFFFEKTPLRFSTRPTDEIDSVSLKVEYALFSPLTGIGVVCCFFRHSPTWHRRGRAPFSCGTCALVESSAVLVKVGAAIVVGPSRDELPQPGRDLAAGLGVDLALAVAAYEKQVDRVARVDRHLRSALPPDALIVFKLAIPISLAKKQRKMQKPA